MDIPEPLRARLAEREARSDLEKVRSLLQGYVEDSDGIDEIRNGLARTARRNTHFLRQELAAVESLLTAELPSGTLFRLVAVNGGWDLDHDPTDAGAAVFLRELAGWVREAIDAAG
ncbi:hypothetical protein [Paractinoplanes lichenicola]|uniref:Uncharacterized protein n=1 Tax=Paractinoplanes lichenicola TaxID=2802976 RepID=A0ABS1VNA9_9ACTN|nr:hypothetical protein [Actinoplanes lichenicola]MBL7256210.1 hypothetical protein [Actinoplanes lichenicola]